MSHALESTTAVESNHIDTHDDEYLIEQLIRQIQAGHESAAFQLREFMGRGVRWYLRRNARAKAIEETTHKVLDAMIQAVKDYGVTNLSSLTSFTRMSVRAFASNPSGTKAKAGPIDPARVERVKQALYELSEPERDALIRYFEGQPQARICIDLGISDEQFTALRLRLLSRCCELAIRH